MSKGDVGASGAWIFLSHSNKDLPRVREVRDQLERRGHNPLIFFLKCLEDDGSELPDLLRREIGARTWFILCDSPNSRASKWVQEEVEMIRSLEGKVFATVDLNADSQTIAAALAPLSERATVFLSCAAADTVVAQRIAAALRLADFGVWDVTDLHPGTDWASAAQSALDDAIARGFVLLLLSPQAVRSRFWWAEVKYALANSTSSRRDRIVPVLIDDANAMLASLPEELAAIQCFDMTVSEFDARMLELIDHLKTISMA